jgi:hypothetical protein
MAISKKNSKNIATFHPKKPLLFYATPIWFPNKVDVVVS